MELGAENYIFDDISSVEPREDKKDNIGNAYFVVIETTEGLAYGYQDVMRRDNDGNILHDDVLEFVKKPEKSDPAAHGAYEDFKRALIKDRKESKKTEELIEPTLVAFNPRIEKIIENPTGQEKTVKFEKVPINKLQRSANFFLENDKKIEVEYPKVQVQEEIEPKGPLSLLERLASAAEWIDEKIGKERIDKASEWFDGVVKDTFFGGAMGAGLGAAVVAGSMLMGGGFAFAPVLFSAAMGAVGFAALQQATNIFEHFSGEEEKKEEGKKAEKETLRGVILETVKEIGNSLGTGFGKVKKEAGEFREHPLQKSVAAAKATATGAVKAAKGTVTGAVAAAKGLVSAAKKAGKNVRKTVDELGHNAKENIKLPFKAVYNLFSKNGQGKKEEGRHKNNGQREEGQEAQETQREANAKTRNNGKAKGDAKSDGLWDAIILGDDSIDLEDVGVAEKGGADSRKSQFEQLTKQGNGRSGHREK